MKKIQLILFKLKKNNKKQTSKTINSIKNNFNIRKKCQ